MTVESARSNLSRFGSLTPCYLSVVVNGIPYRRDVETRTTLAMSIDPTIAQILRMKMASTIADNV